MLKKGLLICAFAIAPPTTGWSKQQDDALYPGPAGTPLTTGESSLIKSIFGDEIKLENVRKYFSSKEKPGKDQGYVVPAQTFGENSIKFYGTRYKSTDYSRSEDIFNFGTFVHEITHIWQNQQPRHEASPDKPLSSHAYKYTLTPQSHFKDFGEEQQAAIIEDYARQFLYFGRSSHAKAQLHNLSLLQKIVENRFPEARKTRLALEAQQKVAPAVQTPKLA